MSASQHPQTDPQQPHKAPAAAEPTVDVNAAPKDPDQNGAAAQDHTSNGTAETAIASNDPSDEAATAEQPTPPAEGSGSGINGTSSDSAAPTPETGAAAQAATDGTAVKAAEAGDTQEAAQAGDTQEAAQEASPAKAGPRPFPVPKPSALARPKPAAAVVAPTPAPVPVAPAQGESTGGAEAPLDPEEVAAAAAFGKVDDDGTVSVRDGEDYRVVGQYPGVSEEEALRLYIRRFLDLKAQVDLFSARLGQLGVKDLDSTLTSLTEAVAEPAVVGDIHGLRERVAALQGRVSERKEEIASERAAAKERALTERTAIVERAEKIAAREPHRIQWRQDGQRLRQLLEEWKQAQRSGPRLDRNTEDGLWKRFSAARTQFDRVRRQHFAELDRTHAEAKAKKEKLIAEAEALSSSRDWGPTSAAYRDLMDRWKRAGRASRKDDDALWARFRAAQDVFFEARNAANAALDAEYAENLKVKEQLLEEAEALVPVRDLDKAKAALRDIQDRWDEAGKVPRGDIGRVEGRLRAVEQAIRDVEQEQWRKSNPRVRARAEGAAAQLEESIQALERDLAAARESGDEAAISRASDALEARKAWLEQVLQAADDAR
ncbi:MAG TPA: DUF349 domain-containing protein [Beutenbergiaceae bacterium]|nr:DUF349 domain-containing protein [Beutenbergiaceae bacterium]